MSHRAYYTRKYTSAGQAPQQQIEENAVQKLFSLLAIPALIGLLAYVIQPGWMAWASLPMPVWLRWAGVVIALIGFALLQWAHNALGKNWSDIPGVQREHTLTTSGPYQWIRHPIYTAFILILGSTLLISANAFIGGLWLLMTVGDVFFRVRVEETLMAERFGAAYAEYAAHTGALFPWIG